jgi:uncharacterized membrane protein
MAKVTAWVCAIIGILIVLAAAGVFSITDAWLLWIVGLGVLLVAAGKFQRSYGKRKR